VTLLLALYALFIDFIVPLFVGIALVVLLAATVDAVLFRRF